MTISDPFWLENVERARRTPGEEKMVAGAELYDYATGIVLAGIRNQNPGVSEHRIMELLRERHKIAERLWGPR